MADPLNWSEWGNYDACVTLSALTGLDYGGVRNFPAGRYSMYEGLALESVPAPNRVGDYASLIPAVQARYGVTIRALSVGTLAAAIARPGMGLLLAGWGSIPGTGWVNPNFQQYHSVFVVDKPPGSCLLFDPMMANQTPGQLVPVSTILAWAKGAGPNDAREIAEDEFAQTAGDDMAIVVNATQFLSPDGRATPREVDFQAGPIRGYQLDGSGRDFVIGDGGSWARADARCTITGRPDAPVGSPFVRMIDGVFATGGPWYVYEDGAKVKARPDPPPVSPGFTQKEVDEKIAAAIADLPPPVTPAPAPVPAGVDIPGALAALNAIPTQTNRIATARTEIVRLKNLAKLKLGG
jgi:hypothetical protein